MLQEKPHHLLVVDDERPGHSADCRGGGLGRERHGRRLGRHFRQGHGEGGAGPGLALDRDLALELAYDAVADAQAEARSAIRTLRREEGIEDPSHVLGRDAAPVVRNGQDGAGGALGDADGQNRFGDLAHGLEGIQDEIESFFISCSKSRFDFRI